MVGAACYFAYTQTSNDLSAQLESSLQSEQSVSFTKENVPKSTTSAPSTTTYTRTTTTTPAVTEAMVPATAEPAAVQSAPAAPVNKPVMPVEGDVSIPSAMGNWSNPQPLVPGKPTTVRILPQRLAMTW